MQSKISKVLILALVVSLTTINTVYADDTSTSEIMESVTFEDLTIYSIDPECGFVQNSDNIEVHPYYNSSKYVTIRKVLLSENDFTETVVKSFNKKNAYVCDRYWYYVNATGNTIGYLPFSKDYAYIVETSTLPSLYVRAVLNKCQRNTPQTPT